MSHSLTLTGITKSFGTASILSGLSATFSAGQKTLLLGANGAGKSTLLRICAGLARADKGEVKFDNSKTPLSHRIGYAGHQPLMYGELTVRENLALCADLMKLSVDLDERIAAWGLNSHSDARLTTLSKGLQARVSLLRALLHSPEFLFLDEPTSALDERSVDLLAQMIKANDEVHKGSSTVIIITHDIARLKLLASRVLILNKGTISTDTDSLTKTRELSYTSARDEVINDYISSNR